MTCDEIRPELIAYHFGMIEAAARARVEAHLPCCGGCVTELIATKRAIEVAGDDAPRPSDAARARLRAAVARAIGAAPRRWWERPAAYAFAASVVLAALAAMHSMTPG